MPCVIFVFSRKRCDDNANMMQSVDLTTASEKHQITRCVGRPFASGGNNRACSFFNKCIDRLQGTDKILPQVDDDSRRFLRFTRIVACILGHSNAQLLRTRLCNPSFGRFADPQRGKLEICAGDNFRYRLLQVVELLFQRGLVKVLFGTYFKVFLHKCATLNCSNRDVQHGRQYASANGCFRLDGKIRRQPNTRSQSDRIHANGGSSRPPRPRRDRHCDYTRQARAAARLHVRAAADGQRRRRAARLQRRRRCCF